MLLYQIMIAAQLAGFFTLALISSSSWWVAGALTIVVALSAFALRQRRYVVEYWLTFANCAALVAFYFMRVRS